MLTCERAYQTIDLCAGIGGIRKAFELTGRFENVLSAEIDKYACRTYKHLFDEDPSNDVTSPEFMALVKKTKYDVLLAGFPCQSFSKAGKKKGFSGADKGTIFFHLVTVIKKTRPKAVFLENVENLVRHDGGATFKKIIETLEDVLNYRVIGVSRDEDGELVYEPKKFIRNSRKFGVPQNRPRVYIIAFDGEAYSEEKLAGLPGFLPKDNDETIFEDLNGVIELGAPARYYLSSGLLKTLERHKARNAAKGNGFGLRIVYGPGIEHPMANTIMATGGSGKERNLVVDIQEGIPGMVIESKKTPLNDRCIRTMTPREWGKLQGFIGYAFKDGDDDTFSFPEGMSVAQQFKQFGNSVTIPAVKTMADFMAKCLDYLEGEKLQDDAG